MRWWGWVVLGAGVVGDDKPIWQINGAHYFAIIEEHT